MDAASVEVPLVSDIFYLLMIVFYFLMPVIRSVVKCSPFLSCIREYQGK